MALGKPQTYHAISGDELGKILLERVKQGIHQALDLRNIRAYPLLRYKIAVELTPYQPAGDDTPTADAAQRFLCEGQQFVEITENAVALVEESPIIGYEVDPQQVRERAGIGRMTTKKVEGQNVDVHEKPPGVEAPAFHEPAAPAPPAAVLTEAQARAIDTEQRETWSTISPDADFHRAIATEQEVPGRVVIVKK